MTPTDKTRRTWNTRRPMAIGLCAVIFLVTAIGVWAARANISGAVIGQGTIILSTSMTTVQHPIGGVVSEILARDGDTVRAGDVVLQLDDFQLKSDLKVVENDLYENLANIARLQAVIEHRTEMVPHPVLKEALETNWDVQALMGRQAQQLEAHFENLETQSGLLNEQIHQIEAQIDGIKAQVMAKTDERAVLAQESDKLAALSDRGLAKSSEVFSLEKALVAVRGELGRLNANIAELRGKITELELKRHAVIPDARQLAEVELTRLRPERTRFLERRANLLDGLRKLEIRAPVSGKIHDSKVQGLQSVVVAASPLMMIVPDDDPVMVGVRIFATDIDQVYVGQEASLKFKAFNGRDTPIILGRVMQMSADAYLDTVTRKPYYDVRVELLSPEMAKLGEKELLPGMPVDAFLTTESRTPLAYVLRPIKTYFDRAFRDA